MAISKNIRSYPHIKAVLDAALERGGARYQCDSDRAAVRWRLEAYQFRKLAQKLAQDAILMPGVIAPTPYDNMFLTIEGATVIIQLRSDVVQQGRLTDLEGKPFVGNELIARNDDEEMERIAEQVRKDLIG